MVRYTCSSAWHYHSSAWHHQPARRGRFGVVTLSKLCFDFVCDEPGHDPPALSIAPSTAPLVSSSDKTIPSGAPGP